MTEDIIKYASLSPEALLEKLEQTKPPFDPFNMAESMGVIVKREVDLREDDASGEIKLSPRDNKKIEIWVDPLNVINRQRFTMAHELGHLVKDILPDFENFHDPIIDTPKTLKRDGASNPKEYAANRFAARLLMPKFSIIKESRAIIDEYKDNNNNMISIIDFTSLMAERFVVSEIAMKIRLKTLKIIKG